MGLVQLFKIVSIPLQRGAVRLRRSAAKLRFVFEHLFFSNRFGSLYGPATTSYHIAPPPHPTTSLLPLHLFPPSPCLIYFPICFLHASPPSTSSSYLPHISLPFTSRIHLHHLPPPSSTMYFPHLPPPDAFPIHLDLTLLYEHGLACNLYKGYSM